MKIHKILLEKYLINLFAWRIVKKIRHFQKFPEKLENVKYLLNRSPHKKRHS